MSKAIVTVGVAAVVVAGVAVGLQQAENRALRREVELLRVQVEMLGKAVDKGGNGKSAVMVSAAEGTAVMDRRYSGGEELGKLREEIAALRKSTQALNKFAEMAQAAQAAKALEKTGESVATKLVPVAQWKNAGKGTPEAGVETALWAANGGDVETLRGMLTFTDSARAKAEAWFAGLSENVRREYGSAENVIALLIARDAASLTGMQVLGKKEVSPNDVGVRVRFAADDKTKDDTFLMHRGADGWRLLLPDQAVESFARKLSGKR